MDWRQDLKQHERAAGKRQRHRQRLASFQRPDDDAGRNREDGR
jgi:hypothetical protein